MITSKSLEMNLAKIVAKNVCGRVYRDDRTRDVEVLPHDPGEPFPTGRRVYPVIYG